MSDTIIDEKEEVIKKKTLKERVLQDLDLNMKLSKILFMICIILGIAFTIFVNGAEIALILSGVIFILLNLYLTRKIYNSLTLGFLVIVFVVICNNLAILGIKPVEITELKESIKIDKFLKNNRVLLTDEDQTVENIGVLFWEMKARECSNMLKITYIEDFTQGPIKTYIKKEQKTRYDIDYRYCKYNEGVNPNKLEPTIK